MADAYTQAVLQKGKNCLRIDIVFDRYRELSIKSHTRHKRSKTCHPIRRVIENRNVPLPNNWSNFLALQENKIDLCWFLWEQILLQAPEDKIIVVAGGFERDETVCCNKRYVDVSFLCSNHEEADTRMILHAIHCRRQSHVHHVIISARDTDVLLLPVVHCREIDATTIWQYQGLSTGY